MVASLPLTTFPSTESTPNKLNHSWVNWGQWGRNIQKTLSWPGFNFRHQDWQTSVLIAAPPHILNVTSVMLMPHWCSRWCIRIHVVWWTALNATHRMRSIRQMTKTDDLWKRLNLIKNNYRYRYFIIETLQICRIKMIRCIHIWTDLSFQYIITLYI